jgi:hypothetical protein
MICFIALIVFAVLAVFSAKYRAYFKEALDCVFRKATLRKCTTSFDKKMKMKVTSKISKKAPGLGRFVFKNFDVLSWIITIVSIIIMIWSLWYGVLGVYNWYAYGNCDGPDSDEFCVYNAITGTTVATPTCEVLGCSSDCQAPNYELCAGDCNCGDTLSCA